MNSGPKICLCSSLHNCAFQKKKKKTIKKYRIQNSSVASPAAPPTPVPEFCILPVPSVSHTWAGHCTGPAWNTGSPKFLTEMSESLGRFLFYWAAPGWEIRCLRQPGGRASGQPHACTWVCTTVCSRGQRSSPHSCQRQHRGLRAWAWPTGSLLHWPTPRGRRGSEGQDMHGSPHNAQAGVAHGLGACGWGPAAMVRDPLRPGPAQTPAPHCSSAELGDSWAPRTVAGLTQHFASSPPAPNNLAFPELCLFANPRAGGDHNQLQSTRLIL